MILALIGGPYKTDCVYTPSTMDTHSSAPEYYYNIEHQDV